MSDVGDFNNFTMNLFILHNLVAKLRHSKMLLQKIRGLFGLPKNVDDDEDLVTVVELYVRNLGLAKTERW